MAYIKPENPMKKGDDYIYPITTYDQIVMSNGEKWDGGIDLLDCYPVGAIYMSVNSTSPASLFGGTWTRLTDRFLVGAGLTYAAGSTGGAATVTLRPSNFPGSSIVMWQNTSGGSLTVSGFEEKSITKAANAWLTTSVNVANNNGFMQRDQPVDNIPPYMAVYMWQRTA